MHTAGELPREELPAGPVEVMDSGLGKEVAEEVPAAPRDVCDRSTQCLHRVCRRIRPERDKEDQERHPAPYQDFLDHCGLLTLVAGSTSFITLLGPLQLTLTLMVY